MFHVGLLPWTRLHTLVLLLLLSSQAIFGRLFTVASLLSLQSFLNAAASHLSLAQNFGAGFAIATTSTINTQSADNNKGSSQ